MKTCIIGLFLLFCCNFTFAQTEKGTFVLSGKTDLHFLFSQNTYGTDSINVSRVKSNEFGFSFGAGYFIADNFSVGLSAAYNYLDTRGESYQGPQGAVEEITSTMGIIPQASYYFPVEGKLKPSVAVGIGYNWMKVRNSQSPTDNNITYYGSGPSYNGGLSASYFISCSVSFDLSVQYSHNRLKEKSSDWLRKQNAVAGIVGISVYL